MTFPEKPVAIAPHEEVSIEELKQSLRGLRILFNLVLILLLVLAGSLFLFLLREVSQIRRQTRELTQFVDNYNKNSVPAMLDFRAKLQEFAKTNPDFRLILARYVNATNTGDFGKSPAGSEPDEKRARMPVVPVK